MKFKIDDKVIYECKEYVVEEVFDHDRSYIIADLEGFKCGVFEKDLKLVKPTIEDLRDYMLEHFVDDNGNLDVCGLDFSDFDGDVFVCNMKVKKNLYRHSCEVGGDLIQGWNVVKGNFRSNYNKVNGYFNSIDNKVGGIVFQNEPTKPLKKITIEELEELGYKIKGVN